MSAPLHLDRFENEIYNLFDSAFNKDVKVLSIKFVFKNYIFFFKGWWHLVAFFIISRAKREDEVWKIINEVTKPKEDKNWTLKEGDNIITDGKEIADIFNKFFVK